MSLERIESPSAGFVGGFSVLSVGETAGAAGGCWLLMAAGVGGCGGCWWLLVAAGGWLLVAAGTAGTGLLLVAHELKLQRRGEGE